MKLPLEIIRHYAQNLFSDNIPHSAFAQQTPNSKFSPAMLSRSARNSSNVTRAMCHVVPHEHLYLPHRRLIQRGRHRMLSRHKQSH